MDLIREVKYLNYLIVYYLYLMILYIILLAI
nr:MAG TPA: hypothetical protein [Caudoviricetes sp.]